MTLLRQCGSPVATAGGRPCPGVTFVVSIPFVDLGVGFMLRVEQALDARVHSDNDVVNTNGSGHALRRSGNLGGRCAGTRAGGEVPGTRR